MSENLSKILKYFAQKKKQIYIILYIKAVILLQFINVQWYLEMLKDNYFQQCCSLSFSMFLNNENKSDIYFAPWKGCEVLRWT